MAADHAEENPKRLSSRKAYSNVRSLGGGRDPLPLEPREGSSGFIGSFQCSVGYMSVSESYALK